MTRSGLVGPAARGGLVVPATGFVVLDQDVTFTSASAVRNFAKVFGRDQAADLLKSTAVAAIGPVTADVAAQLGIRVTIQPANYTIPALVEAIAAHFSGQGAAGSWQ